MHDNEMVLSDLFKVIWLKKIPILLILFISIAVGLFYINQKSEIFLIKLDIKDSRESELTRFLHLNKILTEYRGLEIDSQNFDLKESQIKKSFFLKMFLEELMDYQELIFVLENNVYVKSKISQLNNKDRQNVLYGYAKSVSIEKKDKKSNDHVLKIYWHDIEQGKKILNDTLILVGKNVKQSLVDRLNSFLEVKKLTKIDADLSKIDYLIEQSAIARELNYEKNQVSSINFNNQMEHGLPYYLMGYKAIDKEISFIKNRKYRELESIKKEINILKDSASINWVDYNIFLAETRSLKKSSKILIYFIILGLVIGLIYALISYSVFSKKVKG